MKTIEEDVLTAFLNGGLITEEGYNQPQSIQFQRAARTDKGVSAVRQVLSLKLPDVIDLTKVNDELPGQIRVVGVKRTTKGFNCKANCDGRTYSYTMPSFALASPLPSTDEGGYPDGFRLPPDTIERTNQVLKNFIGTHNYHNFTSRRKPLDPSTQRYIISFSCEDPVVIDGVEFVTLKVKGQSFMLHQIRKMVGLVIAIVRGHTTEDTISKAWQQDKLDLPVAPGLGLVLEEVHYDRYNQRYGKDGIHEPIEWSAFENQLEDFRKKYIMSTIVNTEKEEKSYPLFFFFCSVILRIT
ncbi:hypothetical protein AAG570_003279 [Ranatra chinensis]|uniref:Pseudouridine synthase I TruA alpha/beta domain-containing protein n=1 Tax=Ranatra chinensis TaxID=642074 RepID=A0ABD0YUS7_9HEMI